MTSESDKTSCAKESRKVEFGIAGHGAGNIDFHAITTDSESNTELGRYSVMYVSPAPRAPNAVD